MDFMKIALEEAINAGKRGEVPVGATLVHGGKLIARDGNRTLELTDPSAHAEMLVIRAGCNHFGSQRLPDCDLYITLEPCTMCAGAISFALPESDVCISGPMTKREERWSMVSGFSINPPATMRQTFIRI